MTDSTRGVRFRRGSRRPGWALLSALLVLAIVASSALVFTDRVELLKLAVILALWAAVVAAFVSFIYRRQSDMDGAKARDLKLVYDLQLDREISARREYELSIESQLRRELTSELRAQASDEVAGLRAELAALRANLQILFDTELQDRPAIETDRSSVRSHREWPGAPEGTDRVISSRIDADWGERSDGKGEAADVYAYDNPKTEESPIIDVPAEPDLSYEQRMDPAGGAHRMASDIDRTRHHWQQPPPASTRPTPAPAQPAPRRLQPCARLDPDSSASSAAAIRADAGAGIRADSLAARTRFAASTSTAATSSSVPAPTPPPVWEPTVEPQPEPRVSFPWSPAEPAAQAVPEEPKQAAPPMADVPQEWRLPPLGDFTSLASPEPAFGNGFARHPRTTTRLGRSVHQNLR